MMHFFDQENKGSTVEKLMISLSTLRALGQETLQSVLSTGANKVQTSFSARELADINEGCMNG